MYGTHPIPPSDRITLSRGCVTNTGDITRSDRAAMVSRLMSEMIRGVGASGCGMIGRDEDPMCRHIAVSVSSRADSIGSHVSDQKDANPRAAGFSMNVIARDPFAAVRSISAALARA